MERDREFGRSGTALSLLTLGQTIPATASYQKLQTFALTFSP